LLTVEIFHFKQLTAQYLFQLLSKRRKIYTHFSRSLQRTEYKVLSSLEPNVAMVWETVAVNNQLQLQLQRRSHQLTVCCKQHIFCRLLSVSIIIMKHGMTKYKHTKILQQKARGGVSLNSHKNFVVECFFVRFGNIKLPLGCN